MPTESTLTDDLQLFADIAGGNQRAFATLFYRYNDQLYRFAFKILEVETLARDVVQEVFLRIWLGREKLAVMHRPDRFLFVMAKNHCLDQLDRMAVRRRHQEAWTHSAGRSEPSAEEKLLHKESMSSLHEAVASLPEQQRLVFRMAKLEGRSRNEIAEQLNLSPHTVKNHLGAAVRAVQQYLHDNDQFVVLILFLKIWSQR